MANQLCNILPPERISALVKSWLQEDAPNFDYGGYVVGEKLSRAKLLMKSPGFVAGVPFFNAIFKELDCQVHWTANEGQHFDNEGLPLMVSEVTGKCKNILLGERVALNCICRASGIATSAKNYLQQAQKMRWHGRIAGTRKTTPGFRLVEKYALLVAGIDTHRLNLSSMVMLKDNHIWSCGSVTQAVKKVKTVSGFSTKIEVECQSLEEGIEAATAGVDVVMFDNFMPKELHKAAASLKNSHPGVLVEASGGINENNFTEYCGPHVDIISTSKLIQGYPVVDFSLKIVKG